LNNFTFKVFPAPLGQRNRRGIQPARPIESKKTSSSGTVQTNAAMRQNEEKLIVPQEPCPVPEKPPVLPPCPPSSPMPHHPPMAPPMPHHPPMAPIVPGVPPMTPYPYSPGCPQFPQTPPQYPVQPGYPCGQVRLAHACVPWQFYNVVYSPTEALDKGTMFPELFQPQGVYGPCEGPQPCHTYFPGGGVPYGSC